MQAITIDVHPVRWVLCKAAGWLTPRVFWSALSSLRLQEVGVPELPSPEWVLLKTRLGGICGTDLMAILQRAHPATVLRVTSSFPAVLGHENVATVEKAGAGVKDFAPGDRVCVEPVLGCLTRGIDPPCEPCRKGRFALCQNFTDGLIPPGAMIGVNRLTSGSWAPYFVAHQSQLLRVPESIPDEVAILTDPVACALHGVLRAKPGDDDRVLVLGGGVIGLAVVACLRATGRRCHVTAAVRHEHQADRAGQQGADEVVRSHRGESNAARYDRFASAVGGRRIGAMFGNQLFLGGYDVVFDCIGTGQSLTDAMKLTRPRGTTVELGTSQICVVDTTPLWMAELNLIGAYGRQIENYNGRERHTYTIVFDMISDGLLKLDGWLTHTFRVAQYKQALSLLTSRNRHNVLKVAFDHRYGESS